MSEVRPVKVSTAFTDNFVYLDRGTRAPITGKTNASFIKYLSKNGVGNQSTTGITISEVDAVNNPGEYLVTCDLTSFVTATGCYVLQIFDASSTAYRWDITYLVTSNGDFDGTYGIAQFTATANSGRIMSSGVPVSGATVYFKNPSGVLYTSTTSDASGLYGPVFLNQNGTWTIYATKAGYTTASTTLIVSGTVISGPSADIILATATSGSGITLAELMSYGRRQIRDNVGTKADTELKSSINDALHQYARERRWNWYQTQGSFRLRSSYSTGSVTVTQDSPTVTLSGGTFPTWCGTNSNIKLGTTWYPIQSRDGATQVTLTHNYGEASGSGQSFVVFCNEYELATDCMKFGRIFPGMGWVWGGEAKGYTDILSAQNAYLGGQKYPASWAIYKTRFVCWPFPNQDTILNYLYWRCPAMLVNTSDEADIDPLHLDVLQRAIDYQLAIRYGEVVAGRAPDCYKAYSEALDKAKVMDKSPVATGSVYAGAETSAIPPRVLP